MTVVTGQDNARTRREITVGGNTFGYYSIPAAEAAGLGAAMDAAVGLGIHRDIDSAVAAMVHVGEVRDPDPADHARYDDLYRSVYRRMYGRLRPLYREIRRITGYPSG